MALDTYAGLQAEITAWLHRADLAARVPTFIALAEKVINRKLNIAPREVEVPLTMTPGQRFVTLPAGMSRPIALWLEQDQPRAELIAVTPETLPLNAAQAGAPTYWAIDGANIALDKAADLAYPLTFRYVQDVILSDLNPTHDLLSRAGDMYLYGALAQAAPYMVDDNRIAIWEGKFRQALRDVHAEYSRSRGIANLRTEVPTSFLNR